MSNLNTLRVVEVVPAPVSVAPFARRDVTPAPAPQPATRRGIEHPPEDAFENNEAVRASHDLAVARAIARGIPEERARRLFGFKG
jgi:hypothetical protein